MPRRQQCFKHTCCMLLRRKRKYGNRMWKALLSRLRSEATRQRRRINSGQIALIAGRAYGAIDSSNPTIFFACSATMHPAMVTCPVIQLKLHFIVAVLDGALAPAPTAPTTLQHQCSGFSAQLPKLAARTDFKALSSA